MKPTFSALIVCYVCSMRLMGLLRCLSAVGLAGAALLAASPGTAIASPAELLAAWYPVDAPNALWDGSATGDPLHVTAAGGGGVGIGTVLGRTAVAFPALCPAAPTRCPRAVMEARVNPAHNPGSRPARWGAVLALPPGQTDNGENIIQKGYADRGSQWKLQVDGAAGRPSCVLAGGAPHHIWRLVAPVSIADGGWHAVECQRAGAVLAIVVDQAPLAWLAVPADLAVANDDPVRLGGKGTEPGNDQFHGYLDAAWLFVG
jgi:hypothetical protein